MLLLIYFVIVVVVLGLLKYYYVLPKTRIKKNKTEFIFVEYKKNGTKIDHSIENYELELYIILNRSYTKQSGLRMLKKVENFIPSPKKAYFFYSFFTIWKSFIFFIYKTVTVKRNKSYELIELKKMNGMEKENKLN